MTPMTAESALLVSSLRAQRRHILSAVDGLSPEDMRRAVLPSGWSCVGLVQHLALEVERFWFPGVLGGDPTVLKGLDDAWQVPEDVQPDDVLDTYRREAQRSDAIIETASLDAPPAWWPDFFGEWRLADGRSVVLHVIVETATHAGHLDAARELIDGKQHRVIG